MIPRKRVWLLLEALIYLRAKRPDLLIEWTHIGEGPEWDILVEKKDKYLQDIKVTFTGNINNEKLIEFYKSNPVDLFVNTSIKEGTPVSIMEAISFGIPILATSFGGGGEIVELGAGIMLSQTPTPQEISDKIEDLIMNPQRLKNLRAISKRVWKEHYNSFKNYTVFCEDLIAL